MLISGNKIFVKSAFKDEQEIETVIINNYEYLFGPSSILLEKALIKTSDGVGTIPDAFAIDLDQKRWYIVEAELSLHSVWNHISPQVTKQILASIETISKNRIEEFIIEKIKSDEIVKEKIMDLGIKEIDYRKYISEIIKTIPIVGIPIDYITNDLKNWASTLKNPVKLWTIVKYIEVGNQNNIIYDFPEEFKPEFDTTAEDLATTTVPSDNVTKVIKRIDITIKDLIDTKKLNNEDILKMSYKPRKGNKINVEARIDENGNFNIENGIFTSPTDAALYVLKKAGSDRNTVNGWTSWKTSEGIYISKLRDEI